MIRSLRLCALMMCCGAVWVPSSNAQDLDVQVKVLLASLTGVVPPAGTQWPAALVTGAGVGVLANNELVGRIGRR
jgi:hypothetical protein